MEIHYITGKYRLSGKIAETLGIMDEFEDITLATTGDYTIKMNVTSLSVEKIDNGVLNVKPFAFADYSSQEYEERILDIDRMLDDIYSYMGYKESK